MNDYQRAVADADGTAHLEKTDRDELVRLSQNPTKLVMCSLINRPNWQVFSHALEYGHFHPAHPANDEFDLYFVTWNHLSMQVLVLPKEKLDLTKKLAKKYGLRLVDSIPAMVGSMTLTAIPKTLIALPNYKDKVKHLLRSQGIPCVLLGDMAIELFVMNGPSVYTVENDRDAPKLNPAEEETACSQIVKENEWKYNSLN